MLTFIHEYVSPATFSSFKEGGSWKVRAWAPDHWQAGRWPPAAVASGSGSGGLGQRWPPADGISVEEQPGCPGAERKPTPRGRRERRGLAGVSFKWIRFTNIGF